MESTTFNGPVQVNTASVVVPALSPAADPVNRLSKLMQDKQLAAQRLQAADAALAEFAQEERRAKA